MCPFELVDFQHGGRQLGQPNQRGTRASQGWRGASACYSHRCAGRPLRQQRGARPDRRSSRPSNRGPSTGVAGESTRDHCAPDRRREQLSASAPPEYLTGATGTPASAISASAGTRQLPQYGTRDQIRNTAGRGHRRRNGQRQAGS